LSKKNNFKVVKVLFIEENRMFRWETKKY